MYLSGVALISSVGFGNWGADDRTIFFLPTQVASAWYHHLLPPDLQKVLGDMQPMVIGRLLRSRGTRRFYQVRLPAASRAEADALCRRIHAAGGACLALRS